MPSVIATTSNKPSNPRGPIGGAGFAVRNKANTGARNGNSTSSAYAIASDSAATIAMRNVRRAGSVSASVRIRQQARDADVDLAEQAQHRAAFAVRDHAR